MTNDVLHQVLDTLNLAHMNSYAVDSLVNPIYMCATNNKTNAYGIDGILSDLPHMSNQLLNEFQKANMVTCIR